MIHIGTSGFSYDDWGGPFYPTGLPAAEQLAFYAREFSTVEVNATYYGVPPPRTLKAMADKTPPGFLFTVKAHQDMTHKRTDNTPVFEAFRLAMEPLQVVGKLGCVLAQFPFSFHATAENRGYLGEFAERMAPLPWVAEFRNREWLSAETFAGLRRLGVGFCCVDEPRLPGLIPPVAEATSEIAYVRFHGRNAARWWEHKEAYERYDYTYKAEELAEWVPKVRALQEKAKDVYLFANNHYQGQAVDTARQLILMLGEGTNPQMSAD